MKYKDYYALLGVGRNAGADEIKKAYRKLAQKYHPDTTRDAKGEEKFKDVSEAYQTLKDKEKREAYDALGTSFRPGDEMQPPPGWDQQYRGRAPGGNSGGGFSFEDLDLGDLFERFASRGGAHARAPVKRPGDDHEVTVRLSLEDAFSGTQVDLKLGGADARTIQAKIPQGATEGQRLRLRGQGGKGRNGGRDGDIYLNIALQPHPLFRPKGHDLHLELPLAPWEAALGAQVEVPTLSGAVNLKVPPGTAAGSQLRLGKRGLPKPGGGEGDLYATVQIVNPAVLEERERELFEELAKASRFDPRGHFKSGKGHGD